MSENQAKGHYLVCPDFGSDGVRLSNDTQTRCLHYIVRHIEDIAALPPGVTLEVISLRWHHAGDAYPALGIPEIDSVRNGEEMTLLAFRLGDQITEFIQRTGLEYLVTLSAAETLTWADVFNRAPGG